LATGLLSILGLGATGVAQDRPAGVLTDVPAHLINVPFQANQTFTRVYADGREIPDFRLTIKYARSSDGCLRQDRILWQPSHPLSGVELEQFNTATIGSAEEQALDEVTVFLYGGDAQYYWPNKEPFSDFLITRDPVPPLNIKWKCRAQGLPRDFSYCTANQLVPGKELPEGYALEDLGKKTIEGVSAHGVRIAGPEREEESWCSDELGAMMLIIRRSKGGEWAAKQELKNVKRGELDPSLFRLPEIDRTGRPILPVATNEKSAK